MSNDDNERLDKLLGLCYRSIHLLAGDRLKARQSLRSALETDVNLRALARERASVMTDEGVCSRDHLSRVYGPILRQALNGLEDNG